MKDVRGIIFDCDGVLFDSRRANLAYYNAILDHFDVAPVTETDAANAHLCHTAASPEVFAGLLGKERVNEALEVAATIDYRRFMPWMVPEDHLAESLGDLSADLPLAIATNRGTSMPEILRHFDLADFFQAVVTSRDVPRPKPYPDMLYLAAERLGLPASHLLFIGDSELDREAARRAGILFGAYGGRVAGAVELTGHRELVRMVTGRGGK